MASFLVDVGGTLTTSLVAYWKFEEASGTREDSWGSNDLTDNNSVGQGTGKQGNCIDCEESSTQYLSIADNADMSHSDADFFYAGWIYRESDTGANEAVFNKFDEVVCQVEGGSDDHLYWRVDGGVSATQVKSSTFGALSTGTWYFFIVYHDSVNDEIGISINAGAFDTAAATHGSNDTTNTFYVGSYNGASGEEWDGLIDELGKWDKMPLAQEETDLYNGGSGNTLITFDPAEQCPAWIELEQSALV